MDVSIAGRPRYVDASLPPDHAWPDKRPFDADPEHCFPHLAAARLRHANQERQKAQEALAKSEELYRSVFENMPLGIMYYDQDGIVTDLNENFAQIIGAPKPKIIGFNLPQQLQDDQLRQAILSSLDGRTGYYEGDYRSVTAGKLTSLKVPRPKGH